MRYAIIADTYADEPSLRQVLESIETEGADQVVCLGNIVGYGGQPNECIAILRGWGVLAIRGSHDSVACGLADPWVFSREALARVLWTREVLTDDNSAWLRGLPIGLHFETFKAFPGSPRGLLEQIGFEGLLREYGAFPEARSGGICCVGHPCPPAVIAESGTIPLAPGEVILLDGNTQYFILPGGVGRIGSNKRGGRSGGYGVLDTGNGSYQAFFPGELGSCGVRT